MKEDSNGLSDKLLSQLKAEMKSHEDKEDGLKVGVLLIAMEIRGESLKDHHVSISCKGISPKTAIPALKQLIEVLTDDIAGKAELN